MTAVQQLHNQCLQTLHNKQGSLDIKEQKWRDASGHAVSPVTPLLCSIIHEHLDNFPIWTHVSTSVRSRNWTFTTAGNREGTFPLCRSCPTNGLRSVSQAVQNQLLRLFCVHIALRVLGRPGRSSWRCPFDDVRKLCAVFSPAKLSLWYYRTWLSTDREFRQQQYCLLRPCTATSITNSLAGPSSQYVSNCHRLAPNSLWLSACCTMSAVLLWQRCCLLTLKSPAADSFSGHPSIGNMMWPGP